MISLPYDDDASKPVKKQVPAVSLKLLDLVAFFYFTYVAGLEWGSALGCVAATMATKYFFGVLRHNHIFEVPNVFIEFYQGCKFIQGGVLSIGLLAVGYSLLPSLCQGYLLTDTNSMWLLGAGFGIVCFLLQTWRPMLIVNLIVTGIFLCMTWRSTWAASMTAFKDHGVWGFKDEVLYRPYGYVFFGSLIEASRNIFIRPNLPEWVYVPLHRFFDMVLVAAFHLAFC